MITEKLHNILSAWELIIPWAVTAANEILAVYERSARRPMAAA